MRLSVISLHQPWASLLFVPDAKEHETRSWPYPERLDRRRILIHAAKRPIALEELSPDLKRLCRARFGSGWPADLPRGALIGYNLDEDRRRHTVTENGVVVVTADDEPFIAPLSEEALRYEADADRRGGGA